MYVDKRILFKDTPMDTHELVRMEPFRFCKLILVSQYHVSDLLMWRLRSLIVRAQGTVASLNVPAQIQVFYKVKSTDRDHEPSYYYLRVLDKIYTWESDLPEQDVLCLVVRYGNNHETFAVHYSRWVFYLLLCHAEVATSF